MSTIKVDNLDTRTGTGNITLNRPLVGDGSGLTSLTAANLTGIVADARFPATLPAASGVNLTALNASNISSGTLPAGRYTDTVYTHPTTAGNKHIPSGGATNQVLTYSSSGTASWATPAAGGTISATDCEAGSRDISIANSTQSFTAFGQQPDLVDIMFVVGGSVRAMCWAKVNANGSDFGVHMNASNADSVAQQWSQTGTAYPLITSSGNQTECQPTITSTGIDLAFTKTGSPTGTCNILITYMKFA